MVTNYEGFYEGGFSSLNSDYGNFTGYRMSAAQLGFPGSPQTANQLGEAINAAKQGAKAFEVELLQPDLSETIPKQHFAEMKALMKLTGVKPSVHGPMIDAAGFDEKGNWGREEGRFMNERRMFGVIEKAAMLDSKGSVPVVFHAAGPGTPGAEFRPGNKEWGEKGEIMERGAMVNKETGQVQGTKREYKFRPERPNLLEKGRKEGEPAGVLFSAENTIASANLGDWESTLTEIAQMNKHAEEIMGDAPLNLPEYANASVVNTKNGGKAFAELDSNGGVVKILQDFNPETNQRASYDKMHKAGLFLENAELSFNSAFHKAYKYGSDEQKKELKVLSEDYAKNLGETEGKVWNPYMRQKILDNSLMRLGEITANKDVVVNGQYVRKIGTPQVYQEVNEFSIDKAATTFGNLAMKSYKKLGADKAPVLAIENFHPGAALSSTKDMIKLVKESRKNFAEQLMKKEGYSKGKAMDIAEEKIGVTWDVGHINMIKKHGFTDEDVVKQTKAIAPMVKHVHLTDNFGYADTHLGPGMGNTPIKKIMEELEKTGRLGDMRKIVEAGAFVQHFKTSPHPLAMAAFGSPIYGMKQGPYFNQAHQVQGSYSGGYGTLNPQTHHQYFGAGFTTMPVELGGQMPGGQSRFGGTPMN